MIAPLRLNLDRALAAPSMAPALLVVATVGVAALLPLAVAPGPGVMATVLVVAAAAVAAPLLLGKAAAERLLLLYIFLAPLHFFMLGDTLVSLERESFGFRLSLSDLIVPVLLAVLLRQRIENGSLLRSRTVLLLVAFVLALNVSWLQSAFFLGSLTTFSTGKLVGLVYLLVFAAAAIEVIRERSLWVRAIDALVLSGAVTGAIGIVGWLIWRVGGVSNHLMDHDRLTSTMWDDPNIFGSFMGVTLILALMRVRLGSGSSRWFWSAAAAIALAALIFSQSRSGSIATAAGLAVLLVWYRPSVALAVATALLVVGALLWATETWVGLPVSGGAGIWNDQRISSDTIESRVGFWRSGAALLPAEGLTGIGVGAFEQINFVQESSRSTGGFARAHNTYLASVLELGLAGTVALGLFGLGVLHAFREGLRRLGREDRWRLAGIASALITMLVFAFFVDALYQRHLWVLIALILAAPRIVEAARRQKTTEVYTGSAVRSTR